MNIIFRKLKALKNIAVRNFRWQADSIICRNELKPKELMSLNYRRIIILSPHSDDEWIGCSRILLKYPKQALVVNMDMPGGDDENLHMIRRNEAEAVAKKYGYGYVTVKNSLNDLTRILSDEKPECVFLPCYLDWHDEHIAVMELFQNAATQACYAGAVAMYQVSLPIPAELINAGYAMTKKQLREKWNCIPTMYKSQAFLPTKRFMINEHINGKLGGSYALEAYSVQEFGVWSNNLKKSLLTDDKKQMCTDNLQRIRYIRTLLRTSAKEEKSEWKIPKSAL